MVDQTSDTPRGWSDGRRPIVVLLVDDQQFIATVVSQLLASESDMELHCCLHASDAVAMANQISPTVVLQDLVMPDIDGLTLVRLFRANPTTAVTPVIVLSGNDDAETRRRALAEGAVDYLVKLPAKPDLIACIRRHGMRVATGDGVSVVPAPRAPRADETLDLAVLATFQDAGPDFARRVIDRFIQEAESRVGILKEAADRGDQDSLKATAHALKGSSMIMGARNLAALCARVEDHPAGSRVEVVTTTLMSEIDRELSRVRDALATHRQGSDSR